MTSIVVTGGAGYIGAHTCHALSCAGWKVHVVDDLSTGHTKSVRWGALHACGVEHQHELQRLLCALRPAAVIHFASRSIVQDSIRDPLLYYGQNVGGLLSLLNAMSAAGVPRLIMSSSAAVYGIPSILPIDEDAPIQPVHPYGHSKAMMERIIHDWTSLGNQAICLRYFNAAGASPALDLGEDHTPETHLIPLILRAAKTGSPIPIYGSSWSTRDGTAERDYIHVLDLAQAHIRALQFLLENPSSTWLALNVGTGQGHTILEVLQEAERVTQRAIALQWEHPRIGDPPRLIANPTRATHCLRWRPIHSTLHSILSSAWEWECARSSSFSSLGSF